MSAKESGLILGGEPRIDFLPPEVKERKQARKTRRGLIALVLVVVVASAGGYVFATSLALQSQIALANEQSRTDDLLAQQLQFAEARTASVELEAVGDALLVGSATEIMWSEYLAELQAVLPAGTEVRTFTVDSQMAGEAAPVSAVPLQNPRIATITLTVTIPDLATGDVLLVNLRQLVGYADAVIPTANLEEGVYVSTVVLNVNADALEKRFFETPAEPAAEEPAAATEEEE